MSKRSLYTVITPLPPTISRATAVAALHNHAEMIQLNPLVIHHAPCRPPPSAAADEFHCTWYELTDRVSYLPGVKGQVSYKACFYDLPRALQTHVYAPAGLDIKEKWSIGGNEPGEEREVIELGLKNAPREGLYLREDVDMRCNLFLTNFVKKTLKRAHSVLVDRLVVKADLADDRKVRETYIAGSQTVSYDNSNASSRSGTLSPSNSFRTPPAYNPSMDRNVPPGPPYPIEKDPRIRNQTSYPASDCSSPTSSFAPESIRTMSMRSTQMPLHPNPIVAAQQRVVAMPKPAFEHQHGYFVAELPADTRSPILEEKAMREAHGYPPIQQTRIAELE